MEKRLKLSDPFVVLLLISSVVFLIVLTTEYSKIVYPPDPRIEYNQQLAQIYIETSEWRVIHMVEENIDLTLLNEGVKSAILIKNWENYKRDPSEYQESSYGKKLWENDNAIVAEQYRIVVDRKNHLLSSGTAQQPLSNAFITELRNVNQNSASLISLLTEDVSRQSGDIILADPITNEAQLNAAIDKWRQLTNYPIPTYMAYYFPSYSQKYQVFVYESYDFLSLSAEGFGTSLSDISFDILTNRDEDLYLRVMSLTKLDGLQGVTNDQVIRPRLIESLKALLSAGEKTGLYINSNYTHDEQTNFRILLLKYLGIQVNEEQEYLFHKAQESTK